MNRAKCHVSDRRWRKRYRLVPSGLGLGTLVMATMAIAAIPVQICDAQGNQREPDVEYVPPADGGLGSTMTLEQQGEVAKSVSSRPIPTINARPAGEPIPSLKYRFWLPQYKLKPASALLHFSRALVMWHGFSAEQRNKIQQWSFDEEEYRPTASELAKAVDELANVYAELDSLALAEDFTWDHRLRDLNGPGMYMYLLPEVQQSRDLARLLRLRVRHHVQQGELDAAITALQAGFKLGAFVGQGETLVQQLVGIAIVGIMVDEVQHMISMPDCPNLYWALATLPRPVVDIRESVQFELGAIHRILPILREAETEQRNADYWNQAWAQLTNDFASLGGLGNESKLAFAVLGVASAEPARERLINSGLDRSEVEAMPAMRAVLLDASREIRRVSDDLTKGSYLPHSYGRAIVTDANDQMGQWIQANRFQSGGAAIAGLLFPAVQAAGSAGTRTQYFVNRLMTVEAIRMYAKRNDGKLPESLEQLTTPPALPNPFSNEPFEYKVESKGSTKIVTLTANGLPPSAKWFKTLRIELAPQR